MAVTHGGDAFLAPSPAGIPLLDAPAIENGLAILAQVRGADGKVVGFASELEVFPRVDFLAADEVEWDTDWTLVLPGRGTLFLHQRERRGELPSKVLLPTLETGRDWQGDWTVTTTSGPRSDGRGVVVGGSGEFEGATGTFVEINRVTRYTTAGVLHDTVELRVELSPR